MREIIGSVSHVGRGSEEEVRRVFVVRVSDVG